MFRPIRRITRRIALGLACAGLGLGLAGSAGAASPSWVLTDREQASDLYLDGQLTDGDGRRWEIGIVPGVRTTARGAAEAFGAAGSRFGRAGGALGDYGTGAFWRARVDQVEDGVSFAGDAVELVTSGIPEGLADTRDDVASLLDEKPFAWAPRALWRTTTGVVFEPPLRVAAGSLGAVGGLGWAVAAPVVSSTKPVFVASGHAAHGVLLDAGLEGVVVPVAKLVWHQPAFALAVLGPEPTPSQNGRFGLRILEPESGSAGERNQTASSGN